MSLFDYQTTLNHPIVMELLHDAQLRTGIKNPVTGLKCIPHGLSSWKLHICIVTPLVLRAYLAARLRLERII
jgi:hypothetical protein